MEPGPRAKAELACHLAAGDDQSPSPIRDLTRVACSHHTVGLEGRGEFGHLLDRGVVSDALVLLEHLVSVGPFDLDRMDLGVEPALANGRSGSNVAPQPEFVELAAGQEPPPPEDLGTHSLGGKTGLVS